MSRVDPEDEATDISLLPSPEVASDTNESTSWRPNLERFISAKRGKGCEEFDKSSQSVKQFYINQNDLIDQYAELSQNLFDPIPITAAISETTIRKRRTTTTCAIASIIVNLLLFGAKMVSTVFSGSLSILSSLVDSAVDLLSGFVMLVTSNSIKRKNFHLYPGGKERMEPLAILILAVIMAMASSLVLVKSTEQIIVYVNLDNNTDIASITPHVGYVDITIICCTIGLKLVLFFMMWKIKLPGVQALAQDHRNDVFSNAAALVMGVVGSKYWILADPIGAMLIAGYIITSWAFTAYDQITMLTGRAAEPDFQKQITWICLNHHVEIIAIDTVIVYHCGTNFMVEVHIVLPEDMTVRRAHDIQESLQLHIEALTRVERAYVHIDYETTHIRQMEHKEI